MMMEDDDTELAWPTRPLRDFETSLRCGICGDFYVMPVSFRACSHAFCSDCARRALPVMEKCPQCREPGRESDLVPNKALEVAVQCFKAVRAELLDAIVAAKGTKAEKKKKKRAAEPVDVVTLLEEEEEEKEVARRGGSSSSSSSRDDDDQQQQQQQQQNNQSAAVVPCPVCNVSVSVKLMNAHLNTCLVKSEQLSSPTTKKKKLQQSSAPSTTLSSSSLRRLPKLAYHVFTLTKLREMCKSAGLNATGDKKQLETRHREFTARVNGVVDYGRIPDRAAIAREVNREEARKIGAGAKARIFNIAAATTNAATTTNTTSDATFARLIEEVRSRQKIPAVKLAVKPPPPSDNDNDDDWCDEEVLPLSQAAPRYVPSSDDE